MYIYIPDIHSDICLSIYTYMCVCVSLPCRIHRLPNNQKLIALSAHNMFSRAPVPPLPVPTPIQHFDWPALAPSEPAPIWSWISWDLCSKNEKIMGDLPSTMGATNPSKRRYNGI